MTLEILVGIAAVVLSLALAYIPALHAKYDQLDAAGKARVMAALLIGVTVAIFALACVGWLTYFGLTIACTVPSAVELFKLLIVALTANQSTFTLLVKPFKKDPEPQG